MGDGGEDGPIDLQYTPTWIVAAVCGVIVFISILVERRLHFLGKVLKRKNQNPLFEALQKVKEELMVMGFISLLLTVCEGGIHRICIPEGWTMHMLPCKKFPTKAATEPESHSGSLGRRLLSEHGSRSSQCTRGRVPLLSLEAIDPLHIFVFILAITHVCFSLFTMILGGTKIRQWKRWEEEIQKEVAEDGLHTYFWIAFVPLILLLAVGTKLEHVIAQLAHEVSKKHSATEGDLIVKPSDDHFWFGRPLLVLYLIHFILFQNAFEVAFFFWKQI